ncbi:MAG: ABC transporter substrate-binding protein, partial [Actinomycetota bacterium]
LLDANTELVEFGSVESIAVTQPELVVGIGHPSFIEIHDELTGVAPTVLPDFTSSWADQTRQVAQTVGRADRAELVISAVEERVAALAAEIEEAGFAGQRAAIVQNFAGEYFGYGPTSVSGTIVEQLGLTRSEAQSGTENFGFVPLSAEVIPDETNVPWVFGVRSTADGAEGPSNLDDPLIGGADSTVADVGEAWFNNSALGAWIVLDDIEAIMFERGEVTGLDGATAAFDDLLAAVEAAG